MSPTYLASFGPGRADAVAHRAVKIFTDGALGSWGAAMHEPYSGESRFGGGGPSRR